jgi:hypothetical protein
MQTDKYFLSGLNEVPVTSESPLNKSILALLQEIDIYTQQFVQRGPGKTYTEDQEKRWQAKVNGLVSIRHSLIGIVFLDASLDHT